MKRIGLLLLLCSSYVSFSQSSNNLSWYKMFTGKIDRYPVTMHLHKAGHQYSGFYYYTSQQQPVDFSGEDSTVKGKIKLLCYTAPDNNEEFLLSFSGNSLSGSWKPNTDHQPVSFTAMETTLPPRFGYVFTSGSVPLRARMKNSPAASYDAAAVWPTGNSANDQFLKKTIRSIFDSSNTGNEAIGSYFLKDKKKFFADYLKEFKTATEAQIKEATPTYSMAASNRLTIAYRSARLLVLAYFNYAYTGGAHGNYGTSYTCIDLEHLKKLQLVDILTAKGRQALPPLLENYFKKSHQLQPTDSLQAGGLFENKLSPTSNFYLTEKGISFNYMPYEIGPYAMGEISIFIPMKELEAYLQPSVKTLF